ncbi:MAG: ANTAR domain-containing protein [Clostridiales bacterium]|nr:ANTAR domain-containing protein [Clostridiales bacterium]MCF8023328.1 ANTAR domain-containing protein [Clostridiales bacterium]
MNGTRLVIADNAEDSRKALRELLRRAGYLVVAEAEDAKTALHHISKTEPDLAVLDTRLKGFENLQVMRVLEDRRTLPLVLAMDYDYKLVSEMASAGGVFGLLVKPVQETALIPTIESALVTFKQVKELEKKNQKLTSELENRKLVERAKGLLMEKKGVAEKDAYRYLQKLSMDKCISMKKAAKNIISYWQK